MSWQEIKTCLYNVRIAAGEDGSLESVWNTAIEVIEKHRDRPPTHFMPILEQLDRLGTDRAKIEILDHGCGSGTTLLYLLAIGYRRIHGVDLGGPGPALNRLLAEIYRVKEPRLFHYDGTFLRFPDSSMDLVFSPHVLEHLGPTMLRSYYAEEARVLRAGGRAYHQVPHRICPYDSHTRTWFIHMLPRSLEGALYRRLGRHADWAEEHLFIRWPWTHSRLASQMIGPTQDITTARLALAIDHGSYEGPKRLRKMLGLAFRLPALGKLAKLAVSRFAMRDTVSVRRPAD